MLYCYVLHLQETILPGTSTVAEYLSFHACLRMPAGTSKQAVRARVAQVGGAAVV